MSLERLRGIPQDQFEAATEIFSRGGYVWPKDPPDPSVPNIIVFNGEQFTDREIRLLDPFRTTPLYGISFVNSKNTDTGIAKAIDDLPSVQSIVISQMAVSDAAVAPLARRNNITYLGLSDCKITSHTLQHIGQQSDLTDLSISNTLVDDVGIRNLEGLKHLQMLGMHKTKITSVALASIAKLGSLERLTLYDTQVDDVGLKHLVSLQKLVYLGLANTQVTNVGMAHLARLSSLKELDVKGTKVDAQGLALLQHMPKLREVHWDGQRVSTPETRLFDARFHLYLPGNSDRWQKQREQFERGELPIP